jgi:hypothetical protein
MRTSSAPQIHLQPLERAEALWLAAGAWRGSLTCVQAALPMVCPAVHAVVLGDLIIRAPLGTSLDQALEAGLPATYTADDIDTAGTAGWHVFVSGLATPVRDVHELDHYRRTLPAFVNGPASRILRLRPRLVSGFRRAPAPEAGAAQ